VRVGSEGTCDLPGTRRRHFVKYTQAQQKAIQKIVQNLQIIPCAGSGKTQVISARVVEILRRGKTRVSDQKTSYPLLLLNPPRTGALMRPYSLPRESFSYCFCWGGSRRRPTNVRWSEPAAAGYYSHRPAGRQRWGAAGAHLPSTREAPLPGRCDVKERSGTRYPGRARPGRRPTRKAEHAKTVGFY